MSFRIKEFFLFQIKKKLEWETHVVISDEETLGTMSSFLDVISLESFFLTLRTIFVPQNS